MIAFFVLFSFLERWKGPGGNQRNTIVCAYFILSRRAGRAGIGGGVLSLALPLYYSFIVTDLHRLLCLLVGVIAGMEGRVDKDILLGPFI